MQASQSFWLTDIPDRDFQSTPELPSQSDVVVIGGGIAGVSTAYWLSKDVISVTLLERRGICGGATGRNGGHINPRTTSDFSQSAKNYGAETALTILKFAHENTEALKAFVSDYAVDCDLSFSGLVWLALNSQELERVSESASALAKYGLIGEYWDASKCAERTRSQNFFGGLFYADAGQLWPAKLVIQMASVAVGQGANLQTGTEVYRVENQGKELIVKSDRGDIITRHVVYATNGWTRHLLPFLKEIIVPVRGQVLITEPAPPMWKFSFSTNFGYEYCLQRSDRRIVLGGMRWLAPNLEVGIDDDTVIDTAVSQGLKAFLPQHFPELSSIQIEKQWTGILGFSKDNLPLIGPLPHRPGEYITAGFSGRGMPIAFLAGRAIAEGIAGRSYRGLVKAFAPSRFFS
ncbi:MAG: FAD-binding oxidoreductase [Microcystis wesenbergii TW10]|jgi:glycine/D-amino acid oxidase-like deaminating enzyme|uniref:FAD-binding oxidoreductase n=1 Tax=Microcystis wesenbergii TW10 TaxID=2060474 RepID=A0A3E0LPB9_9CHRO|nr:MAG: FAD-binding oxidoreductase [Microcystis wesenbergii TW10]